MTTDTSAYIIRQDLKALVNLDTATLPNGCQAFVIDEDCTYQLDLFDPLTQYSPLIIPRGAGNGRWYRKSRAYVVLNFTLWCQCYDTGVVGYTPGQLLKSGNQEAEIVIDMSELFDHNGNQQGSISDNQGNLWVFNDTDAFAHTWAYKVLAKDILRSGRVTPAVILDIPIVGPNGTEAAGGAFDQNNNLWCMNGPHGTFGWSSAVRYTPQESGLSGSLPSHSIGANDSPGTSSNSQDIIFDAGGNMWMTYAFTSGVSGGGNGGILMFSKAQIEAGGTNITPAKQWIGSNFTGVGLAATCQCAFGPDGRIWVTDYPDNKVKAWNLNSPSGNPAPDIILTGFGVNPGDGPYGIAFDVEGNLWLSGGNINVLWRVPKAQLGASGVAVPDITITPVLYVGKMAFANTPERSGIQPSGWPILP